MRSLDTTTATSSSLSCCQGAQSQRAPQSQGRAAGLQVWWAQKYFESGITEGMQQ